MTTVQNIVTVLGLLMTVGGILGGIFATFKSLNKKVAVFEEGLKCLLRSDIMAIYYRHCDDEEPTLREYERKNLDALYASYEAHHGNSFVSDLYNNEMRHWRVTR